MEAQGIQITNPDAASKELDSIITQLRNLKKWEEPMIPAIILELKEAILYKTSFSDAGQFYAINHLIAIGEFILDPSSTKKHKIVKSAFYDLDELLGNKLISLGGQLWIQNESRIRDLLDIIYIIKQHSTNNL